MKERKDVKIIELCFENVDSCKINAQHIKKLYMNGIKKGIYAINPGQSDEMGCAVQSIEHFTYCDFFTITISKSANYTPFLDFGNLPSNRLVNGEKVENSLFDRLMVNDMCSVWFHYTDGTVEEISLLWDEEEEYTNNYQKTQIDKKGDLVITVSKKE